MNLTNLYNNPKVGLVTPSLETLREGTCSRSHSQDGGRAGGQGDLDLGLEPSFLWLRFEQCTVLETSLVLAPQGEMIP